MWVQKKTNALVNAKIAGKAELDEYVKDLAGAKVSSVANVIETEKGKIDALTTDTVSTVVGTAKTAIDNALIAAAKADTDLFPDSVAATTSIKLPQTASDAAMKYGVTLTWGNITQNTASSGAKLENNVLLPISEDGAADSDDTIACTIKRVVSGTESGAAKTVTYTITTTAKERETPAKVALGNKSTD